MNLQDSWHVHEGTERVGEQVLFCFSIFERVDCSLQYVDNILCCTLEGFR